MPPVLLLVFNRPDHTRQVFEQIRRLLPAHLFVRADGPRTHVAADAEKCAAVRAIFEQVDWACAVHTNFLTENHGCRRAVQAGISWFFQQVEAGIILEDDCLPDASFFDFCSEMLERYRDDPEVLHISGNNPAPQVCRGVEAGYLFSRFSFIWGWATWRRAWQLYDPDFTDLETIGKGPSSGLYQISSNPAARRYLLDKFERTRSGELDTWDYAWFYTVLKNKGLCITPRMNLVRNIGFDAAGTHTHSGMATNRENEVSALDTPLVHPQNRAPIPAVERAFFYASQKGRAGLLLRRLAPWFFYKRSGRF
ncbi:MAG: nucleotide-diphospho-sugar transferase [Lewinellaceae bacterium]|nr:nucleotide-diphospho-sugar transferase [Lewinellaceae bacterium]